MRGGEKKFGLKLWGPVFMNKRMENCGFFLPPPFGCDRKNMGGAFFPGNWVFPRSRGCNHLVRGYFLRGSGGCLTDTRWGRRAGFYRTYIWR